MMKRKSEVGSGAFSRFSAREREAKKAKESVKKSESAERERKKRNFALFLPSPTGSPVPQPKDDWQGEKEGS